MVVKHKSEVTFSIKDILYGIVTIGAIIGAVLKGGMIYQEMKAARINQENFNKDLKQEIRSLKACFIDYKIANDKAWREENGVTLDVDEYLQETGHTLRGQPRGNDEAASVEVNKNKEIL